MSDADLVVERGGGVILETKLREKYRPYTHTLSDLSQQSGEGRYQEAAKLYSLEYVPHLRRSEQLLILEPTHIVGDSTGD